MPSEPFFDNILVQDVDIIAQSIAQLNVDIIAQTIGNILVDINAQSMVGNLAMDVAAQSIGNIAIDIAAQSMVGNVDVNLSAQTAAINIDTAGGTNIVIDRLTQAAYLERRTTLTNRGAAALWTYYTGNNRGGKFYPRGCRGFIEDIEVYCYDTAAGGGTITVYIAAYIGGDVLDSAVVTVPPGGAAAWRAAAFNIMWEYDSLFIWCLSSNAQSQMGYDGATPYDDYISADAGVTWAPGDHRFWIRVVLTGATVGDLPISGVINIKDIDSAIDVPISSAIIDLIEAKTGTGIAASNNLKIASDVEAAHTGDVIGTMVKEIAVITPGIWRIMFSYKRSAGAGTGTCRIRKNGVVYGTSRLSTDNWIEYTEDLFFDTGDFCQLWIHNTAAGTETRVKEFRLKGDFGLEYGGVTLE